MICNDGVVKQGSNVLCLVSDEKMFPNKSIHVALVIDVCDDFEKCHMFWCYKPMYSLLEVCCKPCQMHFSHAIPYH